MIRPVSAQARTSTGRETRSTAKCSPVYAAPSEPAARMAGGKSSVQFDDSIVCMGSEGEWRMTSYAGSECSLRVGYIHVLALVQANSTLSAEVNTCLAPMKETCPAETD